MKVVHGTSDKWMASSAHFSDDDQYRYRLYRLWGGSGGLVAWVMLNPSTADENANDPTLARCEKFSRDWGFRAMVIGNLYGLRATDPRELASAQDPIGEWNDDQLREMVSVADMVLVGWGNKADMRRAREVLALIQSLSRRDGPKCLAVNRSGHPVHPLYQPATATPRFFPGYR